MGPIRSKSSPGGLNSPNMPKKVLIYPKGSKWVKIDPNGSILVPKGPNRSKIVQIYIKSFK